MAALRIQWDLHTPWYPQNSGQIERMNMSPKLQQNQKILQQPFLALENQGITLFWPQHATEIISPTHFPDVQSKLFHDT